MKFFCKGTSEKTEIISFIIPIDLNRWEEDTLLYHGSICTLWTRLYHFFIKSKRQTLTSEHSATRIAVQWCKKDWTSGWFCLDLSRCWVTQIQVKSKNKQIKRVNKKHSRSFDLESPAFTFHFGFQIWNFNVWLSLFLIYQTFDSFYLKSFNKKRVRTELKNDECKRKKSFFFSNSINCFSLSVAKEKVNKQFDLVWPQAECPVIVFP